MAGHQGHTIDLRAKLERIHEYRKPKIVADLNDSSVKLVKLKGTFVWHRHAQEDELFHILKGHLRIEFRDGAIDLREGEVAVVPRGTEHRRLAEDEAHALLLEPKTTVNTGEIRDDQTADPEWI